MTRMVSIILTAVLFSLTSNIANADSFGVTLRYWDVEESAPGTTRITPVLAYFAEDSRTDIPGLSLRWSPDFWENHDFLLSYYEKDRNREISSLRVSPDVFPGETGVDESSSQRSDLELLVRTRANENVFFYYGLRYIERDFSRDGTGFLFTFPSTSEQVTS